MAKGYIQSYSVDYQETFVLVAKLNTVRILLPLAANQDWPLLQFDVKNVFLYGEISEEIYIDSPPGMADSNGMKVCKLKKALYGLKQFQEYGLEGSKNDRKSTFRYFTFVGGNLVTWRSKKQPVIARSSAEVEFRGMALGTALVKDGLLSQKAKCNWLKEGDANTSYFHACVNARRRRNQILGISINGVWCEDNDDVACGISNYFKNTFNCDNYVLPTLDGVDFQRISNSQLDNISGNFTTEEIKTTMWSCALEKIPGPDGFNFKFFQEFWDTIKDDISLFLKEFQVNCKLPKGLNSSFISLIPKVLNMVRIEDYRPISLVGSLYKIIAKVLAERLKVVLSLVISPSQPAFLGGRIIMDAPFIINEVIHSAKKSPEKCFLFKVDFQKAYDSVNWHQFSVSKGIRQGDPLTHFLFLMVVEGFAGLIRMAISTGIFEGYKESNIWTIKSILRCFELVSSLRVNLKKSSLMGVNILESRIGAAATFLECKVGSIPFNYLGILVGANPRRLSLYKAPKKVLSKLESIQRSFLWGNKIGGRGVAWWRRIQETNSLWVSLLNSKYGDSVRIIPSRGTIGAEFEGNLSKEIGDGKNSGFLLNNWCGSQCLRDLFPRFFLLAEDRDARVADCGCWVDNNWLWNINWHRVLLHREEIIVKDLYDVISGTDSWRWHRDSSSSFIVKLVYIDAMESLITKENTSSQSEFNFLLHHCWKTKAPSKLPLIIPQFVTASLIIHDSYWNADKGSKFW
ncbi:PREDICTED: uncharacterized protein LOC109334402 [Lupinus angustifolius]|uniref:uncharacterized protein LOC109334402 n=1 Tax=Lupinus angustifolius TaxID=3871 RepID=UPI00092EF857|nr:PREDICTED: uncharacterized protein LOC109334402 [Lupinus angustifolius]